MVAEIELIQFLRSPYNEKARWALDMKRVPHRRRSVLPGPHMAICRRISGQTATPILRLEGATIPGSAAILDALEAREPEPPLTPPDFERAEAAREIERRFDDDWGPRIRRATLDACLSDRGYIARMFGGGRLYAASLIVAGALVRKGNGITGPESVADGLDAAEEALTFIAEASAESGYLIGPDFTRADLTAAAMATMIVNVGFDEVDFPPDPPPKLARILARFEDHPGAAWARDVYLGHRPRASAAYSG